MKYYLSLHYSFLGNLPCVKVTHLRRTLSKTNIDRDPPRANIIIKSLLKQ